MEQQTKDLKRRNINHNDDEDVIDILRLLKALWHRAWAIFLAAVICGAAGFGYSAFLITPLYEASTLIYVNNSSFTVGSTSFSISSSELSAAQSLVDTYVVILETRTTLEEVIEEADLDYSYETLLGMIEAGAVNDTEIFEITVTSADPEEATLIANTIADVLPDKIADIVDGSDVRIVDRAVIPSSKSSPSVTRYTAIGMLAGIVLSCLIIIVLELYDDVIHNEDYLLETYDVPLLATIPDLRSHGSGRYGGGYYYGYGYGYGQNQSKGSDKK